MTQEQPSFFRCYVRFAGAGLVAAGVVAAIGCILDPANARAAVAGCGATWAAGCAGAVPTASALSTNPRGAGLAALTSTGVRFGAVLLLVVPLVLSGWFPRTALVVFVAVSYLTTLIVDSVMTVRMIQRFSGSNR